MEGCDWVARALERCRGQLEARRVHHGRGGVHGGPEDLALEWYPPFLMVLAYSEEARRSFLLEKERFEAEKGSLAVVIQNRWEKGPPSWERCFGEFPEDLVAVEDGLKYQLRMMGRQTQDCFWRVAKRGVGCEIFLRG